MVIGEDAAVGEYQAVLCFGGLLARAELAGYFGDCLYTWFEYGGLNRDLGVSGRHTCME